MLTVPIDRVHIVYYYVKRTYRYAALQAGLAPAVFFFFKEASYFLTWRDFALRRVVVVVHCVDNDVKYENIEAPQQHMSRRDLFIFMII